MPICYNVIQVISFGDEVENFLRPLEEQHGPLANGAVYPTDVGLLSAYFPAPQFSSSSELYTWREQNWGYIFDVWAYEFETVASGVTALLRFKTSNVPPLAFIELLARRYPIPMFMFGYVNPSDNLSGGLISNPNKEDDFSAPYLVPFDLGAGNCAYLGLPVIPESEPESSWPQGL